MNNIKESNKLYEPLVSIIIPCYNENKEDLSKCIIASCDNDYPNKEIIVIDDGSPNKESWETIQELKKKYHFEAIRFDKNKGKRAGMYYGFTHSKGEIVITMDSDSIIINGDSIRELVAPLIDKRIGAVSGNIGVIINKNSTLMEKIQHARYWLAFSIEKASQDPYSGVTCASGPFSAYRKEYVLKILEEWNNQYFLGVKTSYGDDRGLCTLILREGYRIKFAKYAICMTNVPTTLRKFIRQQIRWKKSFIRENYYLSKFIYKKNIFMQMEFFWFWTIFIMGFFAKFLAVYFLIIGASNLFNFAFMILFVAHLHYTYAFLRNPGIMGFRGVLYGILNEFLISWLFFWALFTLKDNAWGTR